MNHLPVILGAIIAVTGVIIRFNPKAMSQYRRMSDEKKRHVDIHSMSKIYMISFVATGLLSIFTYFFLRGLRLNGAAEVSALAIILLGIAIGVTLAQRYDYNPQSQLKRYASSITIWMIMLVITGLLIRGTQANKAYIDADSIRFSGQYGTRIQRDQIDETALIYQLPSIQHKKNGFSMGERQKGHFVLDQLGSCRLLIQSYKPPYLLIRLKNGEVTLFNDRDSANTKDVYHRLNHGL